MTTHTQPPLPPAEPPPTDRAKQQGRALRARLDRMAEESLATNPRLAEAVRRRAAAADQARSDVA